MSESVGQSPSTEATDQNAQATPGGTPGSGGTPDGRDGHAPAGEGGTPPAGGEDVAALKKALAAERDAKRAAQKALDDLKAKEQAGQTDAEVLQQRVAELERANKKAKRDALVLSIATEYSIPAALSARLHGETEDELRADAEALKAIIPAQPPQQGTTVGGPQGQPVGGKSPEEWIKVLRARR
jgi:hypothetical protein